MAKCSSHDELVKRIDEIHTDLTKQNERIFGLLESQLKSKDRLNTRIIMISIGTMVIISLGYFGLLKFLPTLLKLV